jgi:hypothetical protein
MKADILLALNLGDPSVDSESHSSLVNRMLDLEVFSQLPFPDTLGKTVAEKRAAFLSFVTGRVSALENYDDSSSSSSSSDSSESEHSPVKKKKKRNKAVKPSRSNSHSSLDDTLIKLASAISANKHSDGDDFVQVAGYNVSTKVISLASKNLFVCVSEINPLKIDSYSGSSKKVKKPKILPNTAMDLANWLGRLVSVYASIHVNMAEPTFARSTSSNWKTADEWIAGARLHIEKICSLQTSYPPKKLVALDLAIRKAQTAALLMWWPWIAPEIPFILLTQGASDRNVANVCTNCGVFGCNYLSCPYTKIKSDDHGRKDSRADNAPKNPKEPNGVCRDFLKNSCKRAKCRFSHVGNPVAAAADD